MKRRRLLIGAGSLLFGSGVLSANAALNDSVNPSTDIRVVADADLIVRAGKAFDDDGSVNQTQPYTNNYTQYDSGNGPVEFFEDNGAGQEGLKDISYSDLPVATVNEPGNTDDDVKMKVAVPNDKLTPGQSGASRYKMRFTNILEVVNNTGKDHNIQIAYERDNSELDKNFGTNGMYGVDLETFATSGGVAGRVSGKITQRKIQYIYTFYGRDSDGTEAQISPDHEDVSDKPPSNKYVACPSGEKCEIDREINLSELYYTSLRTDIKDAAELNTNNPFNQGLDAVDLLDAIEIGAS